MSEIMRRWFFLIMDDIIGKHRATTLITTFVIVCIFDVMYIS